jgi:hypothetical protein
MYAETCNVEQRQLNVRQLTTYNKAARRRQHNLKTYWISKISQNSSLRMRIILLIGLLRWWIWSMFFIYLQAAEFVLRIQYLIISKSRKYATFNETQSFMFTWTQTHTKSSKNPIYSYKLRLYMLQIYSYIFFHVRLCLPCGIIFRLTN